jgi:hypothetical protein
MIVAVISIVCAHNYPRSVGIVVRASAGGLAVRCEGGPLGSLMLPLAWTDRGPAAADTPLTCEVLAEVAGRSWLFSRDTGGDVVDLR